MTRNPVRSALITGALLAATAVAWVLFAPTAIGGSATYVVTNGISMEPRFHTGDLAIVRPAADYRVGDVVAYHSSLLHVVVLHRIIAIRGGHYVFKGDNNDFVDPVHPTRSQLLGRLWLHLPGGGGVLNWLHTPVMGAMLAAVIGVLLLFGSAQTRRRRRRDRRRAHPDPMPSSPAPTASLNPRSAVVGCGVAVAVCLALTALAFFSPTRTVRQSHVSYSQQGRFDYSAAAAPSAVYPSGEVTTGDPVFLSLVHRLRVAMRYRFTTTAAHQISGTQQLFLQLTGPTGWARTLPLTARRPFRGGFSASAELDLPAIQSLLDAVQRLTGMPDTSGYSATVRATVRVRGSVDGRPVTTGFDPQMSFSIQPLQLQPGVSPGTSSPTLSGFSPSAGGSVTTTAPAPATLGLAGHEIAVSLLRRLALAGLLLSLLAAAIAAILLRRAGAFDEPARIQAQYGHMLVPILSGDDLGWPPVDVPEFSALVRLAQSAGLMILHHHGEDADTYLVNDDGTVYRYQARLPKVVWGEWTDRPVKLVA